MKTRFSILLAAIALAVSSNTPAAEGAHAHHHGHGGTEPTKLQLNAGKKWATDEPLRQAMSGINQAMAEALPAIHKNSYGDREYQTLAATVRERVAYALERCKLEPKADAVLHLIIADLMAGAEGMESRTSSSRHDGAVQVTKALKSYGKYFQHPGWKAATG
jgi:hypothetical protein